MPPITYHLLPTYTCRVQTINDGARRHPHSTDEEGRPFLDDDVDEAAQLAPRIILVGRSGASSHFRQEQIDAKGPALVKLFGRKMKDG